MCSNAVRLSFWRQRKGKHKRAETKNQWMRKSPTRTMPKNWKQKEKAKMCGQVCEIQKPAIAVPNWDSLKWHGNRELLVFFFFKLKVRNSTTSIQTLVLSIRWCVCVVIVKFFENVWWLKIFSLLTFEVARTLSWYVWHRLIVPRKYRMIKKNGPPIQNSEKESNVRATIHAKPQLKPTYLCAQNKTKQNNCAATHKPKHLRLKK